MISNIAKCRICGYVMTSEEYIKHMTYKHNDDFKATLKSMFGVLDEENKK
jgi:hypothetical protein